MGDLSNDSSSQNPMLVQITTNGVPKVHCPVCSKALVSLNGYVKHVKKHEPPGGFVCKYCEKRFCLEEDLKAHRDEVHTTIACRICKNDDATFTNVEEYREHIRTKHNGVDRVMYKCEKCSAEYKTLEPFRRHTETECGTVKPHKCDQCQMSFVTKYNLKQHKETHSGVRKFCCSYCGKSFLQKGRLVEHERSHTGQKPYKCDVCGKCFAHRESIVTHSSIHTGVRLVECRCCLSRFSCYSNLIKHRRTRPDTCGQPQYDPPKNRVRMRGSRIPATLNPTSEIKVSNLNKIIKPDDQVQLQNSLKKDSANAQTKNSKVGKTRRKKLKCDSSSDDDDDELSPLDANKITENLTTNKQLATKGKPMWSEGSDDSDNANFDPVEEDETDIDEVSNQTLQLNTLSTINIKQEQDEFILLNEVEHFEYNDPTHYLDTEFDVKTEDNSSNLFNQKDKLLDTLLNDDLSAAGTPMVKVENMLLDETEVILLKDDSAENSAEEDILALTEVDMESKIVLDDVTHRYPKLRRGRSARLTRSEVSSGRVMQHRGVAKKRRRSKNDIDAKVASELVVKDDASTAIPPNEAETEKKTKRKYHKRIESQRSNENNRPKRMAKLTQAELKERISMLKKDEKSWPCPHCIKIYHMRKPFERHLREQHQLPEEEIRKMVKSDEVGVVNEEIFKCHICDKIYLIEKRLLAHLKLHGDDGKLIHKCPCYCNLFFATKEEATSHAHEAHRDALYCEICQKFMNGHDGLKNHMKKHHGAKKEPTETATEEVTTPQSQKRNFVCDKCGRKFSGRTSLTDHVRSNCGRNPLYQCTICGKHLTTAGILKTHLLLHKEETPYQCDQCGKTFKVKAQYKTHLKTRHTDFKPFKCHLCPKEYPYRESLLTHMTVHTGIKRFLCNGCGKRFTCISNLQAHRKVHADTCGLLPLNPKATQYMGVQKGNLLFGAKPEAGLDYNETNTLIAREVLDRDLPMAQELNFPSEPAAPLATVPLNCSQDPPTLPTPHFLMPLMMAPQDFPVNEANASPVYN